MKRVAAPTLRIGVDARSLLCREPRGEGKSLLRLYEEISSLDSNFCIIFFGDERSHEFRGSLPATSQVQILSSYGSRFNSWENIQLPWAAWRRRCDVLHCAGSSSPIWSATPLLLTVHDLIPMLFNDGQSVGDRTLFRRRIARALAQADAVIAVSENTRRDLMNAFPNTVSKVHVVHWGAPTPIATSAAPTEGVPREKYILAFGGTSPRKNTPYTLERYAAIANDVPNFSLVLLGVSDPGQRAQIDRYALQLNLVDRIHMPGFVDEDCLQRLLSKATLVLYLSSYEGFGLPLLEAVAHGVPVVASDASSIPEILSDGSSCYSLASPHLIEQAILNIVNDEQHRQNRVAAQARVAMRFNWKYTASATVALLRMVASR